MTHINISININIDKDPPYNYFELNAVDEPWNQLFLFIPVDVSIIHSLILQLIVNKIYYV